MIKKLQKARKGDRLSSPVVVTEENRQREIGANWSSGSSCRSHRAVVDLRVVLLEPLAAILLELLIVESVERTGRARCTDELEAGVDQAVHEVDTRLVNGTSRVQRDRNRRVQGSTRDSA